MLGKAAPLSSGSGGTHPWGAVPERQRAVVGEGVASGIQQDPSV